MKVSIFIVFIYTSFHIYLNNGSRYDPQSRGTIFALNDKNNDYFLSEYTIFH